MHTARDRHMEKSMCTLLGVRYLMFVVSALRGSHCMWYDPWVLYINDNYEPLFGIYLIFHVTSGYGGRKNFSL